MNDEKKQQIIDEVGDILLVITEQTDKIHPVIYLDSRPLVCHDLITNEPLFAEDADAGITLHDAFVQWCDTAIVEGREPIAPF
jgi:hypothetical protein